MIRLGTSKHILASVIAILLSSLSFRLRKYKVPLGPDFFAKNKELIGEYKKATEDTFNNTMINAYLECMEKNHQENEKKVRFINLALWLFFGSMAITPILLGIVIHAIQVHAIIFPIST